MPAYKYTKNGKTAWYAKVCFQDTTGTNKQHTKRGFKTRKEAEDYEAEYKMALKICPQEGVKSLSEVIQAILVTHNVVPVETSPEPEKTPQKTFKEVYEEYWAMTSIDLRESTIETKLNMLENHVLPFFGECIITEITSDMMKKWQEEMKRKERRGKPFSDTYLHSVQSQVNAILNFATRKTYIPFSPMAGVKNMGMKDAPPHDIWTDEEYNAFSKYAQQRPETYTLFQLYYWLGLRRGEGLGVRPIDIFYDKRTQKSMIQIATSVDAKHRVGRTKTTSSYRTIALPEFLLAELQLYMSKIYELKPTDRIFENITVSQLQRDVSWAIKESGVPKIRIHDMRHSRASALISCPDANLTYTDVADMLGHKTPKTTMNTYSHVLPSTKSAIANLLDEMHSKLK